MKVTDADRQAMREAQVDMLMAGFQGDRDGWERVAEVFAHHREQAFEAGVLSTFDQRTRDLEEVRRDTLEMSAQVADDRAALARELSPNDLQQANTAAQLAQAIRALKP